MREVALAGVGGDWLDTIETGKARPEGERWPLDLAMWR